MNETILHPIGGGMPRSPKKLHGRKWVHDRDRHGLTWTRRKATSRTYCPATKQGTR
jgi:hypothetical protein